MSPDQQDSSSFPSGGNFKAAFDAEMKGAHEDWQRAVARTFEIWPPPPPVKGWKRVKGRAYRAVRGVRVKVARRIAPWLDEY